MKHRLPVLAAAVVSLLALTAGSAFATGTLDQTQVDTSTGVNPVQASLAQTFTAGLSGKLDEADVNLTLPQTAPAVAGAPAIAGITVEIWAAPGGVPTGPALATESVVAVDGWNLVPFTTPPDVLAGTQYALVVAGNLQSWTGDCTNAYANGQGLILDASAWITIPAYGAAHFQDPTPFCLQDFAFRTFVTVAAATPAPTRAATPPPTSTNSSSSGDSPRNLSYLFVFAGLFAAAGAVALVSTTRRRPIRR